jgi:lipopolysaccharide export LptBFGC system permease protein LptF
MSKNDESTPYLEAAVDAGWGETPPPPSVSERKPTLHGIGVSNATIDKIHAMAKAKQAKADKQARELAKKSKKKTQAEERRLAAEQKQKPKQKGTPAGSNEESGDLPESGLSRSAQKRERVRAEVEARQQQIEEARATSAPASPSMRAPADPVKLASQTRPWLIFAAVVLALLALAFALR